MPSHRNETEKPTFDLTFLPIKVLRMTTHVNSYSKSSHKVKKIKTP